MGPGAGAAPPPPSGGKPAGKGKKGGKGTPGDGASPQPPSDRSLKTPEQKAVLEDMFRGARAERRGGRKGAGQGLSRQLLCGWFSFRSAIPRPRACAPPEASPLFRLRSTIAETRPISDPLLASPGFAFPLADL